MRCLDHPNNSISIDSNLIYVIFIHFSFELIINEVVISVRIVNLATDGVCFSFGQLKVMFWYQNLTNIELFLFCFVFELLYRNHTHVSYKYSYNCSPYF